MNERGKQCTVVLSSIYLRALCELSLQNWPPQSGRWTDGRAEGIDTSPDPSSDQGTAHWHGGGSRSERGWPGCHWPTKRWRRTGGMLANVSTGHLFVGCFVQPWTPKETCERCLFCPSLIGWPPHCTRLLNLGSITSHLSLKALWHGHGSSLHGEGGKALRKKQRYLFRHIC